MTETTKTVFGKYEIRKTKKQKTAFIDYVRSVAESEGYDCRVEKGALGARNIVVGDPDSAKVIYTAHYDTCVALPFPNFITPNNIFVYLLYQLSVIFLFMFIPLFFAGFIVGTVLSFANIGEELAIDIAFWIEELIFVALLILLFFGPANKHTANDNTSGVTVLLDAMVAMPTGDREKVAFVFFDLEEAGLLGSMSFAFKHKNAMKDKLLVNFDCVSDGENVIFAVKKKAKKYIPTLNEAFKENGELNIEIAPKGIFYPSDQENFPCGVGVAACRKKRGILYLGRIHTHRDTVYLQRNIDFLTAGAVKLARIS